MNRLWKRRRPAVASRAVRTASGHSDVLVEVRRAADDVTGRVGALASRGALDAGNGDVLDAWLERSRTSWRKRLERERTSSVARAREALVGLRASAVEEQRTADAAQGAVEETQRVLGERAKQIFGAVRDDPGRERRRRPRPTSDPLEGLTVSVGSTITLYGLLLLAAIGDVVTFNLVLSAAFPGAGPEVIWPLTIAFAAASVGLTHAIGRALRNLRERMGGLGRLAIGLMMAAWVALGAVAVFLRANRHTPQLGTAARSSFDIDVAAETAAAAAEALQSAVLLAGLYLAAGLLAFYIGYSEYHPRASAYRSLQRTLRRRQRTATKAAARAARAQSEVEHAESEAQRAERRLADGCAEVDATVAELKELVRVLVAEQVGLPEATSGLTSLRTPDDVVATVPAPRAGADSTAERMARAEADALAARTSSNGHGSLNGHRKDQA